MLGCTESKIIISLSLTPHHFLGNLCPPDRLTVPTSERQTLHISDWKIASGASAYKAPSRLKFRVDSSRSVTDDPMDISHLAFEVTSISWQRYCHGYAKKLWRCHYSTWAIMAATLSRLSGASVHFELIIIVSRTQNWFLAPFSDADGALQKASGSCITSRENLL